MPMLPSGRHIGLDPAPLVELLKNASHFGNVHKVMALRAWPDLYPWIDVLYFVPEGGEGRLDDGRFSDDSRPAPPGMVAVKAGYRLHDWEVHAADWDEEDRTAFREVLDGRARQHFEQHLEQVRRLQEKLRSPEAGFLPNVLAGWHDAGVHPAQEEGWKEDGQAHTGNRKQ